MVELAKIEQVDLREVWSNEAVDFTPWLEDNIDQLSEALRMEIEVEEREASVGSFSLDLLARDGSGRPVIIENQLEATDHSHLGQILTYAAGHDANVIVWIAKEFRDEHRAALEFLNGRTGEDTEFFAVVAEVWKIEESRPAPHFRVVSAPNDWQKQARRDSTPSELGEKYREFFQSLIDILREEHQFTNARKAQTDSFYEFSSGYTGVRHSVSITKKGPARTYLYIDNGDKDWNERLFDQLIERKGAIEAGLGESLDWRRLNSYRACRILTGRQGSIEDDEEALEEIREWMIDRLIAFERVFGPILAELAG